MPVLLSIREFLRLLSDSAVHLELVSFEFRAGNRCFISAQAIPRK
jgi:hypothetical protein